MTQVYECLAVDITTKDCTNWQIVVKPDPESEQLPITKHDADILTMAIIGFMVFVRILLEIKRSI